MRTRNPANDNSDVTDKPILVLIRCQQLTSLVDVKNRYGSQKLQIFLLVLFGCRSRYGRRETQRPMSGDAWRSWQWLRQPLSLSVSTNQHVHSKSFDVIEHYNLRCQQIHHNKSTPSQLPIKDNFHHFLNHLSTPIP